MALNEQTWGGDVYGSKMGRDGLVTLNEEFKETMRKEGFKCDLSYLEF